MRTRVDQLVEWSRTHQGRKLIRFTSVSVVATATSQLGILMFFGVFHVWGIIGSTIAANLVATIPSYHLNRKWTWGKHGRSHLVKEIIPFWTISGMGITFSFFGSLLAKHLVGLHTFPHVSHVAAWPFVLVTLIVMAANFISFGIFWVLKLMLFNRIFHVSELQEVEEHLELEEADAFAHRGEELSL
jgi:putative flippase GtrA